MFMNKASWIWYPGDYEIYHSNLLHSRREDFGIEYVTFWQVPSIYPRVDFSSRFTALNDTKIKVVSSSKGFFYLDGKQCPLNIETAVLKGEHEIKVRLMNVTGGLPCVFIDSDYLKTDASWTVTNGSENAVLVGTSKIYDKEDITPETFLFSYKKVDYVSRVKVDGGFNYDFSKEMYGKVVLKNVSPNAKITVCYGESKEESLDMDFATIKETVCGKTEYRLASRAFRYISIFGDVSEEFNVYADYEYLPIEDIASFECDDAEIKKIFDACAYTFHLNSREFFIDGIKRDHWVWSGDAYQSFMINNYLYFDTDITKRTIRALLGKPPYEQHINTINDYSLYLFISVYEYYYSTGDKTFVESVFDRVNALYEFVVSRLDENGFVCKRGDDWIFIDWSDIDMQGPVCAEQILLWRATVCMGKISEICGKEGNKYYRAARCLKERIINYYWNQEKQAFIDSYESGKNKVSRQANIFAILYDFIDNETQKILFKTVLQNDKVTQITTPYFKFFELMAVCKMNNLELMQDLLDSYWGGMLKLGATSIWEAFDPNQNGTEHYAMYGNKYGKSLCHAWGSGPIYLLGRYCLGVYPTDIGYKTFAVEPRLGKYKRIKGTVPLPDGKVNVEYCNGKLSVMATKSGGILIACGQQIKLPKDETVILECSL